jgi:RimJ/RimL family protein N-acetyltransferase
MADWCAQPDLVGRRLMLTPLTLDDAEHMCRALAESGAASAVFEHLSVEPPRTTSEAVRQIEQALRTPGRMAYAQRLRATGEFVGSTSFYDMDPALRALAIGFSWLCRPWWGTGLNTESKFLLLGHAFDQLHAERVVWHTDIRNLRSQRAIEGLGATREGVLRHHRIRRDGSWRDTVQYSMLREEWPEVKARLLASAEMPSRSTSG